MVVGTSLLRLVPIDHKPRVADALQKAATGTFVQLRHNLEARTGVLEVDTSLFLLPSSGIIQLLITVL